MTITQSPGQTTTQALSSGRHLTDSFLDRLFTPHGASAYLRWIGVNTPSPSVSAPAAPAPETGAPRETDVAIVRFARSGGEAPAGGTLLETAEAAGLEPRFRCRRGICGTCTTPKLAGRVRDTRTDETSDAVGPVRICVSVACGDVTLDL